MFKEKLNEMLLKLLTEIVSVKTLAIVGMFILFVYGKLSSTDFIVAVLGIIGVRQIDKTLLKLKIEKNKILEKAENLIKTLLEDEDVKSIKCNKEKQKISK